MRILVVCGAGASSTFVARRIRKAADARALDATAEACPLESLAERLPTARVVLLGPHLGDRLADVRRLADAAGTAVAVLPPTVFSSPLGDEALDLALEAAGAGHDTGNHSAATGGPSHG